MESTDNSLRLITAPENGSMGPVTSILAPAISVKKRKNLKKDRIEKYRLKVMMQEMKKQTSN